MRRIFKISIESFKHSHIKELNEKIESLTKALAQAESNLEEITKSNNNSASLAVQYFHMAERDMLAMLNAKSESRILKLQLDRLMKIDERVKEI